MLVSDYIPVNMAPVIQCSVSGVSLIPGPSFTTRKSSQLAKCSCLGKSARKTSSPIKFLLPLSTASLRLFPPCKTRCGLCHETRTHISSTLGAEVAIEGADPQTGDGISESPAAVEVSEDSLTKSGGKAPPVPAKRTRATWKSEMPPVKNEELVLGATFTGKVKAIQPFGAFVDIGAFTDGLVHVSRISDSFVKDVGSFVSVGQEVMVKLVEANFETGRISLSMRELNSSNKMQLREEAPESSDTARAARNFTPKAYQKKDDVKKVSKFVVGQELQGTVKNLNRSGAFVSLPEEEEGFLPRSEESVELYANPIGGSSLRVGQEVNVRVLRSFRGHVTLTMKSEDSYDLNSNQGVVHTATNPFVLAFRKNKTIAAYLDKRNKVVEPTEIKEILKASEETDEKVEQSTIGHAILEADDQLAGGSDSLAGEILLQEMAGETNILDKGSNESVKNEEDSDGIISKLSQSVDELQIIEEQVEVSTENMAAEGTVSNDMLRQSTIGHAILEADDQFAGGSESLADEILLQEVGGETNILDNGSNESVKNNEDSNGVISKLSQSVDGVQITEEQVVSIENLAFEGAASNENQILTNASERPGVECGIENTLSRSTVDDVFTKDKLQIATSTPGKEITVATTFDDGKKTLSEKNGNISNSKEQIVFRTCKELQITGEAVENRVDESIAEDGVQVQTTSEVNKIPTNASFEDENARSVPEENSSTFVISEEQTCVPSLKESFTEEAVDNKVNESIAEDGVQVQTPVEQNIPSNAPFEDKMAGLVPEKNGSFVNSEEQTSVPSFREGSTKAISPALVKQLRDETGAGMMDCKNALAETGGDIVKAQEFLRKKGLASADKKASRATAEGRIGSYIHDSRIGVLIEVNCETDFVSRGDIFKELVDDLAMQVAACPQVQYLVTDDVPEDLVNKEREVELQKEDLLSKPEQIRSKIVEGRIRKRLEELALLEQPFIKNDKLVVKDWVKQTIAAIGENIKLKRFVRYNLGEGLEKKIQDFATEVAAQTAAKSVATPAPEKTITDAIQESVQKSAVVIVPAALVKQLREETGAGMMDCKKALSETGGDLEKAQTYLRKKGLSSADKKSNRLAAEGRIGCYIHDSRIGALIEVNSETDFVGRSEKFRELVNDLAMQVVACPQVQFVSIDEIPDSIVKKEKELEMQRDDLLSRPENVRERIVEGRVSKRLGELALLEQAFIKDDSILVKDLVKQAIAALGENIKVRRFIRFTLGEAAEGEKTSHG